MNTTSLEEQLRPTTAEGAPEALVPARLLRGSWLVEQADKRRELLQRQEPFQHLPHRKQLEKEQPTAFLDADEVETVLAEVAAAAKTGTAIMSYPPILVLSYAWKGNEHPDPDGAFLADLAPLLEWYLSERASMQKRGAVDSREIGLFMDFWSLHQRGNGVERTKWEDAVFKGALESMDVWYGHAGTVSLLMSRIPAAWGEVEAGRRFEDRGWCFFERNVSSLVKVGTHVLDGGFFDAQALAAKYPSSATIGDGRFASKDEAALARQATREDRADHPFLASLIQCSRCGPLHPDRFPEALKSKAFSWEEDREVVETLYNKVAHGVLSSVEKTSFSHLQWSTRDFAECGHTLTLCNNLKELRLNHSAMDAAGMRALLEPLGAPEAPVSGIGLPQLQQLQIKDNPLQDEGLQVLANALRQGKLPELKKLLVRDNSETAVGEEDLQAACTERQVALNRDTDKAQKRWTEKQGERDKSLREASLERRRRREEHRV